jgi:hypothetical protein
VSCKSCVSENQRNLNGEIGVHIPGLKGLDKPIVWVFPKLVLCLNCGFTEFVVPATELRRGHMRHPSRPPPWPVPLLLPRAHTC